MVDVDGIAREAAQGVRDSAAQVDLPELNNVHLSRRRRTGLAAAAGAFAVTLIVVGVAASDGESAPGVIDVAVSSTVPDTVTTAPDATTVVSRDVRTPGNVDGVGFETPTGWQVASETLTPGRIDPIELFSIATFPLSPDNDLCDPFPWQAVVDFPADGAFVTLRERFQRPVSTPRPAVFGPEAPPYALPEGDCLDNTSRGDIGTMRWFEFEDQSRSFELLVVIGLGASEAVVAEAWQVANSINVVGVDRPAPLTTETVYGGNAFVLDRGTGPEVCGFVAASRPPQCSGPRLIGLDWDQVPWAESTQGVTWADMYIEFHVVDGELILDSMPTERKEVVVPEPAFPPPPENLDVMAVIEQIRAIRVPDWPTGIVGVFSYEPDEVNGYVRLSALLVTPEGQQWLDDRFGAGAVRATGSFQPVAEIAVSDPAPPIPTAPSLPGEPHTVRAREALYYCGAAPWGLATDIPPELGITQVDGAKACFEERLAAGQTAELIVVQPTIEGDPIISIFRVLADGSAEVFRDTTRDTFGSQAWFRYTCESYTLDPIGPQTCTEPERITE